MKKIISILIFLGICAALWVLYIEFIDQGRTEQVNQKTGTILPEASVNSQSRNTSSNKEKKVTVCRII